MVLQALKQPLQHIPMLKTIVLLVLCSLKFTSHYKHLFFLIYMSYFSLLTYTPRVRVKLLKPVQIKPSIFSIKITPMTGLTNKTLLMCILLILSPTMLLSLRILVWISFLLWLFMIIRHLIIFLRCNTVKLY